MTKDPFMALTSATRKLLEKEEVTIELDKRIENNLIKNTIRSWFDTSSRQEGKNSSQRYKLCFLLGFRDHFYLKPALVYIKQDGSLGRVVGFDPHKLTEPVSEEENFLLKNLNSRNEGLANLLFYIDMIDSRNLYIYEEFRHEAVLLKNCSRVKVNFEIDEIRDKVAAFRPSIELLGNDGDTVAESVDLSNMDIISGCFCYYNSSTATLIYNVKDNDLVSFLEFVIRTNTSFYPANIVQLKSSIPQELKDKIFLNFDYEKISIQTVVPRSHISVKDSAGELQLKLFFTYRYYDLAYTDNREYIIDSRNKSPRDLYIIQRSHEFENTVHDVLIEVFEEGGDDPFSASSGNLFEDLEEKSRDYQFTLALSMYNFLVKYGLNLIDRGIDIKIEGVKLVKSNAPRVVFHVSRDMDWFDIQARVQDEDRVPYPLELNSELLKSGLIKTRGVFTFISQKDVDILERLSREGMDESGVLRTSSLNYSVIDEIYEKTVNNEDDDIQKCLEINKKLRNFKAIKNEPPPRGFKGVLRHYQKAGYNWLHFIHSYELGGCLADDMGLGKTVQTLAFLQRLKEKKGPSASLLVSPIVTLANWEAEISKFTPELRFIRHGGPKRTQSLDELLACDLVLVSYHTLRNDIEMFVQGEFFYIILDEAHYIKNSGSRVFKAVRSLKSAYRLSLTGTPLENNTMELWSQMDFLNPGLLGTRKDFKDTYATPIDKQGDGEAAEALRKLVFPFIMRRKKQDVLNELPEKEEIVFYSDMGPEQKELYNQTKEYYKSVLTDTIEEKGLSYSSIEIFDCLLKLRQIALFPAIVNREAYSHIESCKFESLKTLLSRLIGEDHKILIFSQFVRSLELIRDWCRSRKLKYSFLSGATRDRGKEVKKFQEQEDVKIFLLSLKAGGVGINLTAADYVILFDPWWNPAVEAQAVDRAYRMGQTRKVIAYKMIVKGTIEEKILRLQEKKKELVGELITEEASIFKSLKKEDIFDLFD